MCHLGIPVEDRVIGAASLDANDGPGMKQRTRPVVVEVPYETRLDEQSPGVLDGDDGDS